ncbi:polysaccharide lyase family 7 protein [Pseudoruegeria sp. SK021]|uniref:polysaccharide lyase family 7 protein n=1 Tax=Pseudoruegeria sp. SK021 TaxID=1933035 RepID=UPI00143D2171|nr:polysaccharide lyase family 7 protein [Pseudoruegeria sp. SK021]
MAQRSWTTICFCLASVYGSQAIANTACDASDPLTIISATDDGLYEETHGPENAIDGNLDSDSRWSNQSQGAPKTLLLDLGAKQTLKSLSIAWYNGDTRKSNFAVEVSTDGVAYDILLPEQASGGTSSALEAFAFDPVAAQFIRLLNNGNEANDWNSIVEVAAFGCGVAVDKPDQPVVTERRGSGMFGLDPEASPGENFDLLGWYVTTPADDDGDGISDSVYETALAAGWTDPRYFYTDPATGGMVFRVTPAGAKTSANTSYTRTELRGMLRRGDDTIETRVDGGYPNKNNWVFSSAPLSAQAASGGVDGKMTATLAVNQVTRLGKAYQVGRVVIGQIHAKNDEPIRLYYRKLPQNKYGSLYFAHDPEVGKEAWVDVIGSRGDRIDNPEDGIALDEVFTYEIEVKGAPEGDQIIPMLYLTIIRDDGSVVKAEPFDMRDSGFSVEDEFMFFKAGAYAGNNTSPEPETDFDKVIFYALDVSHDPAPAEGPALGAGKPDAPAKRAPVAATLATPGVVVNDSFTDGGRDDGADAADSNWLTTTASSAIEVSTGSLGLVSGGSGRGIRTTFAPQALAEGQTLQATFTFITPATIGEDRESAFRIGLYDTLGRAGLEADLSASSDTPNPLYDGLPGYMIDFDVNLADTAAANIDIRKHKQDTQGRLLGTTKGYDNLGGGGAAYQFAPEQTYTGVIAIQKLAEGVKIAGSLSQDGSILSEVSLVDEGSDVDTFGMLAFHVNSKTFGASKDTDTPDNGIDFTNVTIEVLP